MPEPKDREPRSQHPNAHGRQSDKLGSLDHPASEPSRVGGATFCPMCGHSETFQSGSSDEPTDDLTTTSQSLKDYSPKQATPFVERSSTPQGDVVTPPPAPVPESRPSQVCGKCGRELPADARFCTACRNPVEADPTAAFLITGTTPAGEPIRTIFTGDELLIGKANGCDLVIDDAYVSQLHAQLSLRDGEMYLDDVTSLNGTYLKIARPIPISIGDEFVIGGSTVKVEALNT